MCHSFYPKGHFTTNVSLQFVSASRQLFMPTHSLLLLLLSTHGQSEHWLLCSKPTAHQVSLALMSHMQPKEILHDHTTVQCKALKSPLAPFLPFTSTQRHRTEKSQKCYMRCRDLLFNYGKGSIRQTIFPGYQETTFIIAYFIIAYDLYLLLVSLSIFILVHSHYILESFYQFVDAVAKVFEISHGFLITHSDHTNS